MISGFGKFCVKEKRERRGRNPVTGEDMMLRPRKVVTFKCSARLRDKINKAEIRRGGLEKEDNQTTPEHKTALIPKGGVVEGEWPFGIGNHPHDPFE